ncbi:MAG: sulfotransferase [Woeseiaceae bacterium]|nr:sulfotransferase [Woeseiaceae bacterium]
MTRQREIYDQAQARLRSGDAVAAASICDEALKEFPDDANILCVAARANLALRRFEESARRAEAAVRRYPEFANAHDVYGDLLLATGRADLAVGEYEKTLRLDPARPATLKKIDKARQIASERNSEDTPLAATRIRAPRSRMAFESRIREAEQYMRDGSPDQAEKIYRDILKQDPDHVEAARLLAGIAVHHERYREAEVFLQRAVKMAPDYVRAWADLANVQRELDKIEEAIASATRVMELAPDLAESHMLYASVIGLAGRHEEAIEMYLKAIAASPGRAGAMCSMAHHLKTIGRQDEAIARYRAAIATRPDHAEAYWSLANLKTFRFEDSEVNAMEALLGNKELPDLPRSQIHNALGFEYEARKEFDRAFANFAECNRIRRKSESYDPVDTESTHDRVIELFTEEFLAQAAADPVEPTPILIVGLPRSGSTLIEQILASHSLVDATHELGDLTRAVQTLRRRARKQERFPEFLEKTRAAGWSRIGREYMKRTARYRKCAPFFIDKNPNNFIFIGVLKLALPNAKIINACRHPLDSCLGAYKQLFASGQPFTYEMTELGEYYLQYQRLMEHWHAVLPGFVLDVHYEDVVADLETQVRRLLEFCGLPFEEACLNFHATERAVKTASSEQVRQPIYSSSIHRWRSYEAQLGTLVHILEPLLADLPEASRPAQLLQKQQKTL